MEKIVDDFNNWLDSDDEVVAIMAAKWNDKNHENFRMHTFKDNGEDPKNPNLNKLLLIEVLENWYDVTHGTNIDPIKRKAAFDTIIEDAGNILDMIESM